MMIVDRNMQEPSNFNVNCNQSFNKCASVGELTVWYICLYIKYPLFLLDFNETWFSQ